MDDQKSLEDWCKVHEKDPEYKKMLELCHNYHQIYQDYHSNQQIQNRVNSIAYQNALILILLGV